VDDAVQLLETLAEEEPFEQDWLAKTVCVGVYTPPLTFFLVDIYQGD
jgi:hypothetical protein